MFAGKNREMIGGRSRWWMAIVVIAAILSGPAAIAQAAAGKYTVKSTLDTSDANPGDNLCDDGAGNCTLRAAMEEANAHAGKDTITAALTELDALAVGLDRVVAAAHGHSQAGRACHELGHADQQCPGVWILCPRGGCRRRIRRKSCVREVDER